MTEPVDEKSHSISAAISREIVHILKRETGRGPTKARTHLLDDCALVLLREGHTRTEETMQHAGSDRSVAQGRVDLSTILRAPLVAVVERETGKKVIGFMSSSQQEPSLLSFVFVYVNASVIEPSVDA